MAQAYIRWRRESGAAVGNQAAPSSAFGAKTYYYPARSVQPTPGMDHLLRDDEIRGLDLPTAAIKNFRNPTVAVQSRAYPDATGISLTSILGLPTTTAGDGIILDPAGVAIPAGATRHVWGGTDFPGFRNGVTANNPPTADLDIGYVDQSTFWKARGWGVEELEIANPDDDSTQLSLQGPAAYLDRQANPTLTATLEGITVPLFSRANLSIPTWLAGSGTNQSITLNVRRNIETVRSMGIATTDGWPDTVEYTNDPVGTLVTASLEKRFLDDDDITALIAATGFAAQVRWTTGNQFITGSYPYKLFVEFANAQYSEGTPEELGNKRRHGATYTVRGSSNSGATAATTITLVNSVASYT